MRDRSFRACSSRSHPGNDHGRRLRPSNLTAHGGNTPHAWHDPHKRARHASCISGGPLRPIKIRRRNSMYRTALFAFFVIAFSSTAKAEQYASADHVVHTRLAPVIAHKVVPPFKGVHVYQGRSARR